MNAEISFENKLKELESIIGTIESGTLPLKDLVTTHRRGKELLDALEKELQNAQQVIETINVNTEEK